MASNIAALSAAASDLGLGGALGKQADDQLEELRKKRMRQQQLAALSPASQALGMGAGGVGLGQY